MNSYLDLVKEYEKVHKKGNRITVICVILAVCLVTTIFSMADMEVRAQRIRIENENGNWHFTMKEIPETMAQEIIQKYENKIEHAGWIYGLKVESASTENGKEYELGVGDADIVPEFGIKFVKGSYPDELNEIAMDDSSMKEQGYAIGDTISFITADGSAQSFTISGTINATSELMKYDAGGIILTPETFKQYFTFDEYTCRYVIQLKNAFYAKEIMAEIIEDYGLEEGTLQENVALLALSGQSDNDYMWQLYGVAAALFCMVLAAGVLMIASSFNMKTTERIQFFGMLRCLGATRKQVRCFVLKESIRYSNRAIPIGVIIGTLVSWGACTYLKIANATYFSDMPTIGISGVGIGAGVAVGFLVVLLASYSPCKKAAKVSPLCAINADLSKIGMKKVKTHAKTGLIKVDAALGISHATASKKNLVLMISSFAMSIILFLSFSILVDFMNKGINATQPWTPDISIYSEDYEHVFVDKAKIDEILAVKGVKKAYGRTFSYNATLQYDGTEGVACLASYEKQQFAWSKKYLVAGSLQAVMDGEGVLVEYNPERNYQIDENIHLTINGEDKVVKIKGITSQSPFRLEDGETLLICSEAAFDQLTGTTSQYSIIDVQLKGNATQETVDKTHEIVGDTYLFSDLRKGNQEARAANSTFGLFIYGFLLIIASITAFNIVNSMNMSITARIGQYGAMRAVGMSGRQVRKMVLIEAMTCAVGGSAIGTILGLWCHKQLYGQLITYRWGTIWQIPTTSVIVIAALVLVTTVISIIGPTRKIREMDIISAISAL